MTRPVEALYERQPTAVIDRRYKRNGRVTDPGCREAVGNACPTTNPQNKLDYAEQTRLSDALSRSKSSVMPIVFADRLTSRELRGSKRD